ncbi:MAG: LytTR family transcriptional regulator [Clostridia bacterium]|nr:LytTR family transcriptional regulator [Clostridia bacterium]
MENKLYVKEGRNRTNIPFEEILYMEKYGARVILYTAEREYHFYSTLHELMGKLDDRFFSPHESYILNLNHIRSIENCTVLLIDRQCIRMGEKCMRRLRKKMDENACKY